jgi:predicted RNase H-like HicB family nuclease
MISLKCRYWKDGKFWLGYLESDPDYWTQGYTLDELLPNLQSLQRDIASGIVPLK